MSISNVLILGIAMVLLLCLLVFSMELFIPLQVKLGIHQVCRPYLYTLEARGALDPVEIDNIEEELEELGLESLSISVEKSGEKFGDIISFRVEGRYKQDRMVQLFIRENQTLEFLYEKKISLRKIINQ